MKRSASVVTLRVTFIAALALLGACGDRAPADGLPTVVALSPDSARHSNHAFSPDGARVAYFAPTRESTGMWQLWVANADLTAPLTKLPVLTFSVRPGVMDANGEIAGGIGSYYNDGGAAETFETGEYYAIVAGEDGSEVVGVIVVTADDPRFDGVTVRESGGFILYRE